MFGTSGNPRKLRFQPRNIIQRCLELLPPTILALLLLKGSRELFRIDSVANKVAIVTRETANHSPPQPVKVHDAQLRFCDCVIDKRPCVFDLGLNKGQSSAYYLLNHKTRVLAVEANPVLVKRGRKRFEKSISEGRYKLVHTGIAEHVGQVLTFWVNTKNDKFSSFYERVGCRYPDNTWPKSGDHKYCNRIEVKTATCAQLIRTHGTPQYLKVDVEGMDKTCLHALGDLPLKERPKFVSKENVEPGDLEMLQKLGYNRFKAVNQAFLEDKYKRNPNMRGTSGAWGDEAEDAFVGTRWQSLEEMGARMPLPKRVIVKGKDWKAWYDLHAAK